jgi:hypothetical protein
MYTKQADESGKVEFKAHCFRNYIVLVYSLSANLCITNRTLGSLSL